MCRAGPLHQQTSETFRFRAPPAASLLAGDGGVVDLGSGGSPHGADPYDEQAVWGPRACSRKLR